MAPWGEIVKEDKPPPFLRIWMPVICAAILLMTMVAIGHNHKWKIFTAFIVLAMMLISIWSDFNWEEDRKKTGWEQWSIWALMAPGIVILMILLVSMAKAVSSSS